MNRIFLLLLELIFASALCWWWFASGGFTVRTSKRILSQFVSGIAILVIISGFFISLFYPIGTLGILREPLWVQKIILTGCWLWFSGLGILSWGTWLSLPFVSGLLLLICFPLQSQVTHWFAVALIGLSSPAWIPLRLFRYFDKKSNQP